jgi:hypothetical protein
MQLRAVLCLLGLIGLAGCVSHPVPAPPNQPDPVAALPAVDSSIINVPVSLDLDALATEALKRVPSPVVNGSTTQVLRINFNPGGEPSVAVPACSVTSLTCLASRAGTSLGHAVTIDYTVPVETEISYQAFLRDLQMRLNGSQFTVTTQLEFSVGARIKSRLTQFGIASCGINEAMPRLEFTLPGSVAWGTAGDLVITPGKWSMRWIRPCNITAFQLNVESLLDLPGVRGKVQDAINSAIAANLRQIGLRAALNQAWPILNEPREVQGGVWLLLRPEKVAFADISGNGRFVSSAITVRARPVVVSGAKPVVVIPPVPAPDHLPTGAEGFHIALAGDIGLDKANELLNQKLAGKPITAGSHTVVIDSLRLYGSGNKAVIGLTLSAPIKGEIYALAHPVFDVEKNELRFEDLDFSLATSDMLAKTANWMLHGSLRQSLEQKTRIRFDDDLQDSLKDFRNYRQEFSSGAVVRAALEHVRPQGIYFTQDSIKAYVTLDGKLWLDVGQGRP